MINATTLDDFKTQFTTLLKEDPYSTTRNIVYIWKVEKPIPRLISESNILYIGRTKNTFKSRYSTTTAMQIELEYFETVYKSAIKKYGNISIEIHPVDNTISAEKDALHNYFRQHSELPPLNRAMPRLT